MRLYLDAAPIIYWVEKVAAYYPQVDSRIKQTGVVLISSHLTLMECLVLPLRQGRLGVKQDYDHFFATQLTEIIPFSEVIFREAAEIRAQHNFRTPDALHLAAAVQGACDAFLTNDARLTSFTKIRVEAV
jgi:predicted nucleic acid-binding protein